MKTLFQLLPAGLSAVVLAAHFLFHGNLLLMLATLAMIGLMFVRRPWAARVIQAGLLFGSIEWMRTLFMRLAERKALGQPSVRFGLILAVVAVVTAASALLFGTRRLRRRFRLPGS